MATAYAAVSVGATATLIKAANLSRTYLRIVNWGTNPVFLGNDSSVTVSNGIPLVSAKFYGKDGVWEKGIDEADADSKALRTFKGPVYGIVASGTEDVRYWEEDDSE